MRPWYKKKRFILPLALLALILFISIGSAGGSDAPVAGTPAATSVAAEPTFSDESAADSDEATPLPGASEEATEEPEPEPTKKSLSRDKQNAVDKALSYLDFQAFSKKGLVKQLKYEGFDTKDAEFAASYINANWKDQAAKKAEEYLDNQSFSRSGLEKQLKYEGFTSDQAEYGVKKAFR